MEMEKKQTELNAAKAEYRNIIDALLNNRRIKKKLQNEITELKNK